MARYTGPPPEVSSSPCRSHRRRSGVRTSPLPARPARPRADQGERIPASAAGEAEARFTYGILEKQFRKYYEEANRRSGKTGDELLRILGPDWTTSCTAQASPGPVVRPASWSATATSPSTV